MSSFLVNDKLIWNKWWKPRLTPTHRKSKEKSTRRIFAAHRIVIFLSIKSCTCSSNKSCFMSQEQYVFLNMAVHEQGVLGCVSSNNHVPKTKFDCCTWNIALAKRLLTGAFLTERKRLPAAAIPKNPFCWSLTTERIFQFENQTKFWTSPKMCNLAAKYTSLGMRKVVWADMECSIILCV